MRLVTLHQRASRKSLPEPLLSLVWGEYLENTRMFGNRKIYKQSRAEEISKLEFPHFSHLFSVPNAYFSSKFSAKY